MTTTPEAPRQSLADRLQSMAEVPAPEPVQREQSLLADTAQDFGLRLIPYAVTRLAQSTGELLNTATDFATATALGFEGDLTYSEALDQASDLNPIRIPSSLLSRDAVPDALVPETIAGNIGSAIVQFLIPYTGITKAGKVAKVGTAVESVLARTPAAVRQLAGSTVGRAAVNYGGRNLVAAPMADILAFSGSEERVADVLERMGYSNGLTRWLKTEEDDSIITAKLKNAAEGVVLGIALDSVVGAVRAARRPTRESVDTVARRFTEAHPVTQLVESGAAPRQMAEAMNVPVSSDLTPAASVPDTIESTLRATFTDNTDREMARAVIGSITGTDDTLVRSAIDRGGMAVIQSEVAAIRANMQAASPVNLLNSAAQSFHRIEGLIATVPSTGRTAARAEVQLLADLVDGLPLTPEQTARAEKFQGFLREVYAAAIETGEEIPSRVRDAMDDLVGTPADRVDLRGRNIGTRAPGEPSVLAYNSRQSYASTTGLSPTLPPEVSGFGQSVRDRLVDGFQRASDGSGDAATREAYAATAEEMRAQLRHLMDSDGVRVIVTQNPQPYRSVQAMIQDVEANNRIYISRSADTPKGHPFAGKSGFKGVDGRTGDPVDLSDADVLEAVHLYFGHASAGYGFGPLGTVNAYFAHQSMFKDRRAAQVLATETVALRSAQLATPDAAVTRKAYLSDPGATVHPGDRPAQFLAEDIRQLADDAIDRGLAPLDAIEEAGRAVGINVSRLDYEQASADLLVETARLIRERVDLPTTLYAIRERAEEFAAGDIREFVTGMERVSQIAPDLPAMVVSMRMMEGALGAQLTRLTRAYREATDDGLSNASALRSEAQRTYAALAKMAERRLTIQHGAAATVTAGRITVSESDEPVSDLIAFITQTRQERELDNRITAQLLDQYYRERRSPQVVNAVKSILDSDDFDQIVEHVAESTKHGPKALTSSVRWFNMASEHGWLRIAVNFRRAALVTSLKTMLGITTLSGVERTFTRPLARAFGAAMRRDGRGALDAVGEYADLVLSIGDMLNMAKVADGEGRGFRGVRRLGTVIRTGETSINRLDDPRGIGTFVPPTATEGALGTVNRKAKNAAIATTLAMYRPMQVTDEFFQQINYLTFIRREAKQRAIAVARNQSFPSAKEREQFIADWVQKYTDNAFGADGGFAVDPVHRRVLHEQAARHAARTTYTEEVLGGFVGRLMRFVNGTNAVSFIIPFVKTPGNVLRRGAQMVPGVGEAYTRYRVNEAERAGFRLSQAEIDEMRGEQIIGAAAIAGAMLMAQSGVLTGSGPNNAQERARLRDAGWQPYSFVWSDSNGRKRYLSYQRLEPYAFFLGPVADAAEAFAYMDPGERNQWMTKMLRGASNVLISRTWLSGLTDMMMALAAQRGFNGLVQEMAASFVPSVSAQAAQALDEATREPRTIVQAVRNRVPGLREGIDPRRNVFGEVATPLPMTNGLPDVMDMVNPLAFTLESDDYLIREMARLPTSASPTAPISIGPVDLRTLRSDGGQTAYDRWNEIRGQIRVNGQSLRQAVSELVRSDLYRRAPDPTGYRLADQQNPVKTKADLMAGVFRRYQEAAKRELIREYPLLGRVEELTRQLGYTVGAGERARIEAQLRELTR